MNVLAVPLAAANQYSSPPGIYSSLQSSRIKPLPSTQYPLAYEVANSIRTQMLSQVLMLDLGLFGFCYGRLTIVRVASRTRRRRVDLPLCPVLIRAGSGLTPLRETSDPPLALSLGRKGLSFSRYDTPMRPLYYPLTETVSHILSLCPPVRPLLLSAVPSFLLRPLRL
jgi:hypothetical protein